MGGRRVQTQVAEEDEEVQTLSLGRGKDLVADFVLAGANRLRQRLIEEQFVVGLGQASELLVEDREAMARHANHRALEAWRTRVAARRLIVEWLRLSRGRSV